MHRIRVLTCAALSLLVASPALAQEDINTGSPVNGWGSMGEGGHRFGQTFTVESDALLNNIGFWVAGYGNIYSTYVMGWDGDKATESVFWKSDPAEIGTGYPLQYYEFGTGGLSLTAGVYVAFISAAGHYDGVSDGAAVGYLREDTYTGGHAVIQADVHSPTQDTWYDYPMWDLGLTADLAPVAVPEPMTLLLLGTGLVGVAGVAVRRQRQTSTTRRSTP